MADEESSNVDAFIPMEEEEEGEDELEEGWDDWASDGEEPEQELKCLFCDLRWSSAGELFGHCISEHSFHFGGFRKVFGLDFYSSFKLINFIRAQVSQNKCWSCGASIGGKEDLHNHMQHPIVEIGKSGGLPWESDVYLKPFIQDDALLHSFEVDENEDDDCNMAVDREQLLAELEVAHGLSERDLTEDLLGESSGPSSCSNNTDIAVESHNSDKQASRSHCDQSGTKNLVVSKRNNISGDIKNVNENYFGAYSSFGIHREMIRDKVRTDSYRSALLSNPSIMSGATVMDVGCGTGILSFFAAQAGASKVFAVEASNKMASVATQIAKENGLLWESEVNGKKKDVVTVVNSMVEDLDRIVCLPPHSVDVLVSEWMGYCLLYESMLSSVLYARDRWLKPGGVILPDIATMFVAGFGRGATTMPFWENVYGIDMSCIGKEVFEDSAELPIVDIVDSHDIVTETAELQSLDLTAMKIGDMDFTSSIELKPKLNGPPIMTCYGIVLWFETAFSSRFCKETPLVLSTSPYKSKTHWSQTILTFKEPIATSITSAVTDTNDAVGSTMHPAAKIWTRISIVRAPEHRSIDISLEVAAISANGRKRNFSPQLFNL